MMVIHFNKVLNEEKYKSYSQSCIESSIRECIIRLCIISCCGNQGSSLLYTLILLLECCYRLVHTFNS